MKSPEKMIVVWAERNIYLRGLLAVCNEGYLKSGECPFCEMIWHDGWNHHIDCKLAIEVDDGVGPAD